MKKLTTKQLKIMKHLHLYVCVKEADEAAYLKRVRALAEECARRENCSAADVDAAIARFTGPIFKPEVGEKIKASFDHIRSKRA